MEAEKRKKAKEEKIRKEILDKQKEKELKGEFNGHTINIKVSQGRADEKIDSVKAGFFLLHLKIQSYTCKGNRLKYKTLTSDRD